jgi:hypothetical protein
MRATGSTLLALLALASLTPPPAAAAEARGPIQDNSFLLEEAYNQEPGVIQHIATFHRALNDRSWLVTFTEEWPVGSQTHQASVTISGGRAPGESGAAFGDLLLNYRWQAVGDGESPVALAPRLSLLLPTGDAARGMGTGGVGLQVNVPLSVVLSRQLVSHVNVGASFVPSARASAVEDAPLTSFTAGQSLVWLLHPRLNLLVEALYTHTELAARGETRREESLTVNPGVRAGFDVAGGLQIVPGVSVPIGLGPSRGEVGLLFYLSLEHPFRWAGATAGG